MALGYVCMYIFVFTCMCLTTVLHYMQNLNVGWLVGWFLPKTSMLTCSFYQSKNVSDAEFSKTC